MLRTVLTVTLVASAGHASAASCRYGTDQVLRLNSWSVETDQLGPTVTLNFTNIGGRAFRTIRAMAQFYGASNANFGYSNIDLDLHAAPDETVTQSSRGSVRMDRLSQVPKSEISAIICVTDIIYADGTAKRFK